MTKKLSQDDIDKQLAGGPLRLELDHAPIKNELKEKIAKAQAEQAQAQSDSEDERAYSDEQRESVKVGKISFDFQLLLKVFLVILVLKSWWILVMWGSPFFFKSWPFLGIFRIQPYLIPNFLLGWFLVWKGKQNEDQHEIVTKAFEFLFCQCPVSLVFAVTGLNFVLTTHLGVIAAILCNLVGGVALRYYIPQRYLTSQENSHA